MPKSQVTIFESDDQLGEKAANLIFAGIQQSQSLNRNYVLGCPGGRSPRSTYRALAGLVSASRQSLSHLYIAMMDEYVIELPDGTFRDVPQESHFSCRGFAYREIRDVLNLGLDSQLQLPYANVLVPEANAPEAYEKYLRNTGVDCFLLASGATDGHVAFNGRATSRKAITRVTGLTEETRRDNMHTFPDFAYLEEVPLFGVSIGPDTIASVSSTAIMLLQGGHKHEAFRRLTSASEYEPDWPATIINECKNAVLFADKSAAF